MSDPRPVTAAEAVKRAVSMIGAKNGCYWLGTGGYRPFVVAGQSIDRPFTAIPDASDVRVGTDCAGFALSWCYAIQRHRPGFNKGGAFDCEDDINSNSAIGDACGHRDCFELATGTPLPGDLLVYPTIHLQGKTFVGHAAIVVGTARVNAWDPKHPRYDLLDICQSHGPNGFTPAVVRTDGSVFQRHMLDWEKPEHTTYLLRALP